MPELPEVETIVRELRSKILGEVFTGIDLIWSGSFVADNRLPLINNSIIKISRKGKFIIFRIARRFFGRGPVLSARIG